MPKAVIKSRLVDLDIIEQAEFIAEDNPEAALRYIDAVDRTIRSRANKPTLGGLYKTSNPRLKGLHRLIVPKFKNFGKS